MHVRHVKNMKVVNALTFVSTITKVSEFFLKSDKQDGGINKKDLIIRNVQYQSEKINLDAHKIFLIQNWSFWQGRNCFYHSPACIVEYVSKYIFLVFLEKAKSKKQTNN